MCYYFFVTVFQNGPKRLLHYLILGLLLCPTNFFFVNMAFVSALGRVRLFIVGRKLSKDERVASFSDKFNHVDGICLAEWQQEVDLFVTGTRIWYSGMAYLDALLLVFTFKVLQILISHILRLMGTHKQGRKLSLLR